jgi:hypothetical protein
MVKLDLKKGNTGQRHIRFVSPRPSAIGSEESGHRQLNPANQ